MTGDAEVLFCVGDFVRTRFAAGVIGELTVAPVEAGGGVEALSAIFARSTALLKCFMGATKMGKS